MADVFIDEKFVGTVDDPQVFVKNVRELRRRKELSQSLNISYNDDFNEVYVELTKGRARRPLIIVENGESKLTKELIEKLKSKELNWDNLIENGIIEYLDASEEENSFIALDEPELSKEHTHLEIAPVTILGIVTSMLPYSNYGGGSRLIRGSKIQKQSLGLYAANFLMRMDTDANILHYPQVPIVQTFMHKIFDYKEKPAGQNFTIAVMSFQGYNMQDSVILNKASIDRGLARSTYFRPYSAEELRYSGGLTDEVGVPDKETKGYRSEKDYRLLEKDGIIYTEAKVNQEDALIGKTSPPRFLGSLEEFSVAANVRRESSLVVRHGEEGFVDTTIITENGEGNRLVQVRVRTPRNPEIGDKFSSRHGQKGVIGMLVPPADMPFTASGMTPDIIFSPHGIPGRMTVSHLLELLAGKVGALSGKTINGTTFDAVPEEKLREQLLELGFREDGTETMYNGITGEKFEARIYTGNMYYLKLKHMVANHIHSRASGRIQLLTRQPIEGRARGGGLRLGEMEKDCLVAHGASLLLKERFDSDKTVVYVCDNCGMFAMYDHFKNQPSCTKCGANVEIHPVEMSYAAKLLFDEIKSLNITPKIKLKDKY